MIEKETPMNDRNLKFTIPLGTNEDRNLYYLVVNRRRTVTMGKSTIMD